MTDTPPDSGLVRYYLGHSAYLSHLYIYGQDNRDTTHHVYDFVINRQSCALLDELPLNQFYLHIRNPEVNVKEAYLMLDSAQILAVVYNDHLPDKRRTVDGEHVQALPFSGETLPLVMAHRQSLTIRVVLEQQPMNIYMYLCVIGRRLDPVTRANTLRHPSRKLYQFTCGARHILECGNGRITPQKPTRTEITQYQTPESPIDIPPLYMWKPVQSDGKTRRY